jgi:hypothetical protein
MATLQDITYEVVGVEPTTATILVKYKTPAYAPGLVYPIDLPIIDGAVPTGADLDALIMSLAPVGQLTGEEEKLAWANARAAALVGVDLTPILALVPQPPVGEQPAVSGAQTL